MKKIGLFCLLLACHGLESCKNDQKQNDENSTRVLDEKPIDVTCYRALYENDTIELKINTLKNEKVTGEMEMKLFEMPEKTGKIEGNFNGDTLFVDYTFIQGTNTKKVFKNPMALLKKGNELILGSGKIETYLGRSYFAKETPIDFVKVKYKFTTVECKQK
jgi:hypothetical protein